MEHYPFANGYVRKISVVKWFPDGVEQCRRNAISKYFQIESALWRKVVVATPSSTFSHSFVSVYKRLRDIRARVLK